MPIVTITLQAGRTTDELKSIMDTVHQAMVSALHIAPGSRNQRLVEIKPEHFFYPEGSSADYMSVEIAAFPGRSGKTKAALFQAIYENLQQTIDIAAEDIIILIHEPALHNWGINGRPAG